MFEYLPFIDCDKEFQLFADLGIRDFPPDYEAWLKMTKDRSTESWLQNRIQSKSIRITAIEYAQFCDLRNEEKNLKSLERLVEEKAAGVSFPT